MSSYEYPFRLHKVDSFGKNSVYKPRRLFWLLLIGAILTLVVFSFFVIKGYWWNFITQADEFWDTLKRLFAWDEIDFYKENLNGVNFLDEIAVLLKDTVFNAFVGTVIGGAIGFPLALLAATNIIKFKPLNYLMKAIFAVSRTLPIFIIAIIMLWFMPAAGNRKLILMVGTSVSTIATIAKILYDKIESTNLSTFNLLEGMGINKVQAFRQGVMPQLTKFTITTIFYAFEVNMRYLSIIGMGLSLGFGFEIENNLHTLDSYNKAGFLVLILAMLVFFSEFCSFLTKKFIFSEKDKVINLQEHFVTNWVKKIINHIPTKLYGKIFAIGSVNRLRLKYFLFKKQVQDEYLLKKIKLNPKKDQQKLLSLKDEYNNYFAFLKQQYQLELKIKKLSLKKQTQRVIKKVNFYSAKLLELLTLNQKAVGVYNQQLQEFNKNFAYEQSDDLESIQLRSFDLKAITAKGLKQEHLFFNQQVKGEYLAKKLKLNSKKDRKKIWSLKDEYNNYFAFLKQQYQLQLKIKKLSLKQQTQSVIKKLDLYNYKLLELWLLNQNLVATYEQQSQEFNRNFVYEQNRYFKSIQLRSLDSKVITTLVNNFYTLQTPVLTSDYVLTKQPYGSWLKKLVFFSFILVIFVLLANQIQFHPDSPGVIELGWKHLSQIFVPSWGSFFGHEGSAGYQVQYSAFELIWESISIGVMGTFFGFIISLVLGILSSRVVVGKYVSKPFWLIATLFRPTPSYIYTYLLVALFPLTPFLGAMALSIATVGMLSKYIRESFNGITIPIITNLYSIGLTRFEVFIYGILPQVTSEITSWVLYRLDINIKEVATLGAVHAGNMGFFLDQYLNTGHYNEFASLMYALIVMSLLIEFIISASRSKLLYDKNLKVYDWLVNQAHQISLPKYLLAYDKKGYDNAKNESWYSLKASNMQTGIDLRKIIKKVELTDEEKNLSVNESYAKRIILKEQKSQTTEKKITPFTKKINKQKIITPKVKKFKQKGSLKYLKAYGIYYGYLNSNQNLTSKTLTEILVDQVHQKNLVKNLRYQLFLEKRKL